MKKIVCILLLVGFAILVGLFLMNHIGSRESIDKVEISFPEEKIGETEVIIQEEGSLDDEIKEEKVVEVEVAEDKVVDDSNEIIEQNTGTIFHKAPFVVQAPFGRWENKYYQDGCEEASALIAMSWVKGEEINESIAVEKFSQMVKFQEKNYGNALDTSASDTAKFIRDYYEYKNVVVKYDFEMEDIINELSQGNLVITPMNGRKLANPYFTPPGPINHMLVIVGYDYDTNEIITNDPGTKRGEGFRYPEQGLFESIRNYPTGYHESNPTVRKAMIVISSGN